MKTMKTLNKKLTQLNGILINSNSKLKIMKKNLINLRIKFTIELACDPFVKKTTFLA